MINYPVKFILLGGLIRAFFSMNYQFGVILEQRIEIATPLNSLKRGKIINKNIAVNKINTLSTHINN